MNSILDCSSEGKIVVLKKTPYEMLNDGEESLMAYLKKNYAPWGPDDRMAGFVRDYLSRCTSEPHVTGLKLMYCSGDFHSSRPKTLALFIANILYDWVQNNAAAPPIKPEVKLDALRLILEQKNTIFRDLIINIFDMTAEKELFLPYVQNLLHQKMYKEGCQIAGALKLHSNFHPEAFLLPLCLQDKLAIVDSYLASDEKALIDFVHYIDGLLVGDTFTTMCDFVTRNEIPEWKVTRCGHKPLSKFLARLLKQHKLPPSTCPNLLTRRQRSALHYLIAKRFESQEACTEGWIEMAVEAVGTSREMQLELVECILQRGEFQEAEEWARRFNHPEEVWPPHLLDFSKMSKGSNASSPCTSSEGKTAVTLFTIPLPDDRIILVEDASQFQQFVKAMDDVHIVGLDAEWKPSFGMKDNEIALIQVATENSVFILDRPALAVHVPEYAEILVDRLFHNKAIVKLGFDLLNDVKALKNVMPGLKDMPSAIDLSTLRVPLTEKYHFKFPYSFHHDDVSGGKLKDLVELCSGRTLDKTEQCSNWERRPLRPSQLKYAALDAYCLLFVYDVINSECSRQGISLQEVIGGVVPRSSPPLSVDDIRVVCTWELSRLLKRLRRCGISATYSHTKYPSKKIINLLSKGFMLLTTMEQSWVNSKHNYMVVPAVDEEAQLQHVLTSFGVEVMPQNMNARCPQCNGTSFENLSGENLRLLRAVRSKVASNAPHVTHLNCDTVLDNPVTCTGKEMLVELVPAAVAEEVTDCPVCQNCGTVLWPTSLNDLFKYDY